MRKPLLILAAIAIGACSAPFAPNANILDARLAWPCDRLVVEWAVDARRLQRLIGESVRVREVDGDGRLQLHIMHCRPRRLAFPGAQAIAYAYVLAPVSQASSGITLTRIPPDGWLALHNSAANGTTRPILEMFGYPVVDAILDFAIDEREGDGSIAAALEFANGRIAIDARRHGDAFGRETSSAYLGGGEGYVSAYFGEEKSVRFAASASVRLEGETLLGDFDLSGAPIAASFDRNLVSDRIFWRMPLG